LFSKIDDPSEDERKDSSGSPSRFPSKKELRRMTKRVEWFSVCI